MTRERAIEVLKAFKMCIETTTMTISYRGNNAIPINALNMAIEELENKVLCLGDLENKCKHCTVKGETTHYCYCDMWDSVVDPYGWCNYGEREEMEQDEEQAAIEQLEHDIKHEPTFSNDDGSM